jgi:SPP1 gp7 family putative phage head morphogenesis protein
MSFRDNVRKAATALIIPTMNQSIAAAVSQGMDSSTRLGPNMPVYPADGIAEEPRGFNYPSGYNIAARPRANERMSFGALSGLVNNYDIAQIAITHRIDTIRALKWNIVPMEGIEDDMKPEIAYAKQFFKKPDGRLMFSNWLSKWLWDVFAYDAGTLYRQRNNAGNVIRLKVVDGRTIAPMIDEYGDRPTGSAPAYVQFISGSTWNWLLDEDIIYQPYRPMSDSTYGRAPIEAIVIAASTDIKTQLYFLRKFTDGNIPAGFGVAPDTWSAQQINDFQSVWDALYRGNDKTKNEIRWVPGGSTFEWPDLQNFDDGNEAFEQWLMQKTAAAYHVTPDAMGFVQDSNRSVGESQADVQQQVGDVPTAEHIASILTDVLQQDLGLPLEFEFDTGGEEEDRLATAESDAIYMDHAVVSPSKIAELRFGITDTEMIPRYFANPNAGPIPLSNLMLASAPVDQESGLPLPEIPAAPPQLALPAGTLPAAEQPIPTEAPAAEPAAPAQVSKSEIDQFESFVKARRRRGVWRDFQFNTLDKVWSHRLNVYGYAAIRKDAGQLAAAGLAVLAADTGRVLMLQRALDDRDMASGTWEFPGGHIEPGESPLEAAQREWSEETGKALPVGVCAQDWASPNGVYVGYVWVIEAEALIDCRTNPGEVLNPDDPDGDCAETIAWWDPRQLAGNTAIRAELTADLSLVLNAIINADTDGVAPMTIPFPDGSIIDGQGEMVQEAVPMPEADADPLAKAGWRDKAPGAPQSKYDLKLFDHYEPLLADAIADAIDAIDVGSVVDGFIVKADGDVLIDAIREALKDDGFNLDALNSILEKLYPDAWTAGQHAGYEQLDPHVVEVRGETATVRDIDWGKWKPGNPPAADKIAGEGLKDLLTKAGQTIKDVEDSLLNQISNSLARGIQGGDSIDSMAKDLRDIGLSRSKAQIIAHTESTRAVTSATFDMYDQNGVTEWDLETADDPDEECADIAAQNPHSMDDIEDSPPVHPYCRCAASPVVDSIDGSKVSAVDVQAAEDASGIDFDPAEED